MLSLILLRRLLLRMIKIIFKLNILNPDTKISCEIINPIKRLINAKSISRLNPTSVNVTKILSAIGSIIAPKSDS